MKQQKDRRPAPPVSAQRRESVDVLERVLTKGVRVKNAGAADADDGAAAQDSAWLSVSGVDLINVQTDLSWRALDETEEPPPGTD